MSVKIAVVGAGSFAQCFIPLFKAHPRVEQVALCDSEPSRLAEAARTFDLTRTFPSLQAVCESDITAVAIFTPHWMHAPQAMAALAASKDVYSAVPAAYSLAEMTDLIAAVRRSNRIYMSGETSYYYPETIYCRQRFAAGDFGHVVHGQAEYYHDFDLGLYGVMRRRGGAGWQSMAGDPPMYYCTHSMSMIVSVTGARAVGVSCQGFVDQRREEEPIFGPANRLGNPFSNQTALFAMSDASSSRISEYRRIGHTETVRMSLFGTEGSFEENEAGSAWVTKSARQGVDDLLCLGPGEIARVHPVQRLPKQLLAVPTPYSHHGSHPFLVDDFVTACADRTRPPIDVIQSARYLVPGLIAHESARLGGQFLGVPDL